MTSAVRVRSIAAGLLAAALALTGCSISIGSSDHHDDGTMSGSSAVANGVDPNAVMFAQMMIPHHEQAVEMATLAETRAEDPFITQLAVDIKVGQQPEIDLMAGWLTEWGAPRMTMMEATADHGGHGMAGVLSDEQMAALSAAKGSQFDRLFAEGMIAHHEGAITMAEAVVDSPDPEVSALAKQIIAVQKQEIAQMQSWLDSQQ